MLDDFVTLPALCLNDYVGSATLEFCVEGLSSVAFALVWWAMKDASRDAALNFNMSRCFQVPLRRDVNWWSFCPRLKNDYDRHPPASMRIAPLTWWCNAFFNHSWPTTNTEWSVWYACIRGSMRWGATFLSDIHGYHEIRNCSKVLEWQAPAYTWARRTEAYAECTRGLPSQKVQA